MRLRLLTHAERPSLRHTMPDVWPQFMRHDPIVNEFWPKLYELYADFQLWLLDGKQTVAYACSLPVRWNGLPDERGIEWAMTEGANGSPTTLCAVLVGIAPSHRGRGLAEVILRRMAGLGAAHGLDCLIAPVRPTWKERYPLTSIDSYLTWRREDGLPYDPWLRVHERLGGEVLEPARRSMTIAGARTDWEEWTGLQFPEDGDYVVPGALAPVRFDDGHGTYVEPNVWVKHALD